MTKSKTKAKRKLLIVGLAIVLISAVAVIIKPQIINMPSGKSQKTHTLQVEDLSFKYPHDWSILDSPGSDSIVINSPRGDSEAFQIYISAGGENIYHDEGSKVIGSTPVDFAGKQGYLVFVDTPNAPGRIARAFLSVSDQSATSFFAAVQGGYINVNASYNIEEDITGGKTLENLTEATDDPKYRIVEDIIESMTYK